MSRLRRQIIAVALLLSGSFASAPASAGELAFSDVNPYDIKFLIYEGKPEEAVAEAERLIDGLRPTDNPVVLRLIGEILTNLCRAHRELGQYAQAEAACLEALATFEEGSKLNGTAGSYVFLLALPELAVTYEEMGEFEAALEVRKRQLKRIDDGRRSDPKKVRLLTQIGELHVSMGHFREAEAAYLEAIAAKAEVWQEDRGPLTMPYINLTTLYRLEERFDRAEATLKEGIAETEKTSAGMTEAQSRLAFNLHAFKLSLLSQSFGWTYYQQGRFNEARKVAGEVLASYEREGDADSWFAADLKVLLARIEDAEHPGSPEAKRYLETAIEVSDEGNGLGYFFQAIARSELARHHLLTGNDAAAEPLAREAVETLVWALGEDNYQTARAQFVLAQVLQHQTKYTEALAQAQFAFAAQWTYLPTYHSEIGETLSLMAELYTVLGEDDNHAATESLLVQYRAERAKFERGN